jgi:hypothetical protein
VTLDRESAALGGDHADGDVQRSALRDLVALCADAAATETETDRLHTSQHATAQKELQRALAEIEQSHDAQKQTVLDEYDARIAKVDAEHATGLAQVKSQESTARQRLEYENDSVDQDIRSKLQQSIWLAESVFEATQNQIAKEYRKAKEEHGNHVQELDETRKATLQALVTYGQGKLQSTVPAPPAPQGPPGLYDQHRDAAKAMLAKFQRLIVPRLFVGLRPYLLFIAICVAAMFAAQAATGGIPGGYNWVLRPDVIGYAAGAGAALATVLGIILWFLGKSQVRKAYIPLLEATLAADRANEAALADARAQRDLKTTRATKKRDLEVQAA